MSYEHNVGAETRADLRPKRRQGPIGRYLSCLARLREAGFWARSSNMAPEQAREYADARILEALGQEQDDHDSPSLPQADLSDEEEHDAQEEFERKYPRP